MSQTFDSPCTLLPAKIPISSPSHTTPVPQSLCERKIWINANFHKAELRELGVYYDKFEMTWWRHNTTIKWRLFFFQYLMIIDDAEINVSSWFFDHMSSLLTKQGPFSKRGNDTSAKLVVLFFSSGKRKLAYIKLGGWLRTYNTKYVMQTQKTDFDDDKKVKRENWHFLLLKWSFQQ